MSILKKVKRLSQLYLVNMPYDYWQRKACRYGLSRQSKTKVFGIGRNKTGTTSLQDALIELGYRVAPTRKGELLLDSWSRQDFDPIISLCREYDAFQDVPFGLPGTYQAMDKAFPGSKFILTVRDSAEQWFDSLVRFHSKLFGNGSVPSWDDLKKADYCTQGYMAKLQRLVYQADVNGLYNKDSYIDHYHRYNESVRNYFSDRPDDFLELNVADADSFQRFIQFLDIDSTEMTDFPWANRTDQVAQRE